MENLSIIVDFGCPFDCWFCIAGSQKTKKSFNLKKTLIDDLSTICHEQNIKRISISGGGEPLYFHDESSEEILNFFHTVDIFCAINGIDLSIHTNRPKISKEIENMNIHKFVISVNDKNYQKKFNNWSEVKTKIRFTHVSPGNDTDLIRKMIEALPEDSQFTIKQMDGTLISHFCDVLIYLEEINDKRVRFLPSGDYNLYYNLDTEKTYSCYKEMLKDL